MNWKQSIKKKTIKSASLLWYMANFMRFGTFFPTIRHIKRKRDRIFVIGNGPSLNKDIPPYINELKNEDIMMVNQAITHHLALKLEPKYYVLMDPAYWGLYTDEEDIDGELTKCVTELNQCLRRISWELYLFAPYHFYQRRNKKSITLENKLLQVKTFNAVELSSFMRLQKWLYEQNFAIPSGINVLIASLCCAIVMGYKEIYLLGADSNWHTQLGVDEHNRVYSLETHYYHDQAQKCYTPYPLSFHMQCITEAFKAYDRLGMTFPHILNLSSTSMIDAFPRKHIVSVFNGGGAICDNWLAPYHSLAHITPTRSIGDSYVAA